MLSRETSETGSAGGIRDVNTCMGVESVDIRTEVTAWDPRRWVGLGEYPRYAKAEGRGRFHRRRVGVGEATVAADGREEGQGRHDSRAERMKWCPVTGRYGSSGVGLRCRIERAVGV